MQWLRAQPHHNGKVGVIGTCTDGRHGFLYACHTKSIDALAELWGGRVAMKISLESAKAFAPALSRAIEAAEEVEGTRLRGT